MTEFTLDTGNVAWHAFYDTLPKFAQGYIEAAFSWGIDYCQKEGHVVEISGLGLDNMSAGLLAGMVGDTIWFQAKNIVALDLVCSEQDYNMTQAGRDLWFTRNYCGIGYSDNIAPETWAVKSLVETARAMGKFPLFAEPLCADADPLDASQWAVKSNRQPIPATPEEWAAVKRNDK